MKQKPLYPAIDAEIAALRIQITRLDIPGKKTRVAATTAEHDAFAAAHPNTRFDRPSESTLLTLQSARDNARADLRDAERDCARLNREVDQLVALLTADDRAALAKQGMDAAAPLVDAAQQAVNTVEAAQAEIQRLVDAEMQVVNAAKTHAGTDLLAQIKAGTPGKLARVSRERLDTLLLAQEAAAAELIEAQEVLHQCVADLDAARHDHMQALVDITGRALHLGARDYAVALKNHRGACGESGRYFAEPDLHLLVRQLEAETPDDET